MVTMDTVFSSVGAIILAAFVGAVGVAFYVLRGRK